MKRMDAPFLLFCFLICHSLLAQSAMDQILPTRGGEVVFTQVRELKEKAIASHLDQAKSWFLQQNFTFEQIQETDPSRDKASGRGFIEVLWGPNDFAQYFKTLKFDIEIVVKKDRYQYRLDHFTVQDGALESQLEIYQSDTKLGGRYNPAFYKEIDHKINALLEGLDGQLNAGGLPR